MVFPGNHILARGISPRDITPVDMLRVPLVKEVVDVPRWVVHRTTGVVLPACWGDEVAVWPPAREQGVIAHGLDLASGESRAGLSVASAAAGTSCRGRRTGRGRGAGMAIARDGLGVGVRPRAGPARVAMRVLGKA